MNIFGRPPQIADDTVQYQLYPSPDQSSKAEAEAQAALILQFVSELLPGHLWHRDAFAIRPAPDPSVSNQWILEGRMRVGDAVDDEWLVVWLLKNVTAKWDVVASIYDTDGEFLLIEAAEHLPSWITPSNSENRVWIYQSMLHIIPLQYTSSSAEKPRHRRKFPGLNESDGEDENVGSQEYISTIDAIQLVRDAKTSTMASIAIQEAVWHRITGYPSAARQHIHYTSAFLPIDVARAASHDPSLVQRAVEAFYTRDAIQLRCLHRMARFPPHPDCLCTVKLTRTSYAQLTGQKFHPPKLFGVWKEPDNTKSWRWRDIGMKIACGFEILFQESKLRSSHVDNFTTDSAVDAATEALQRNPEYQHYISTLQRVGFFRGEISGSQKWQHLEKQASTKFLEMHRDDTSSRPTFANSVDAALSSCPQESFHPSVCEEDSDTWLFLKEGELEGVLQARRGILPSQLANSSSEAGRDEDQQTQDHAEKLQEIASQVREFVDGRGSLTGAKFQDENDSDDDSEIGMELDDFSDFDESTSESIKEQTDAERQELMDNLVPGIDAVDYGKMPASYYEMSQSTKAESAASYYNGADFRKPLFPRDHYDGVDSDDDTDEDGEQDLYETIEEAAEESDEDKPQVVGDVEVDMSGEMEDFLKFSKQLLNIDEDLWSKILKDREARGSFVPNLSEDTPIAQSNVVEQDGEGPVQGFSALESFEAVMEAMENELARQKSFASSSNTLKPHFTQPVGDYSGTGARDENEKDAEKAMQDELKAALVQDESDGNEDELTSADVDYKLIKNFLESYKSQNGLPGPVGSLLGRLQPSWKLPGDSDMKYS